MLIEQTDRRYESWKFESYSYIYLFRKKNRIKLFSISTIRHLCLTNIRPMFHSCGLYRFLFWKKDVDYCSTKNIFVNFDSHLKKPHHLTHILMFLCSILTLTCLVMDFKIKSITYFEKLSSGKTRLHEKFHFSLTCITSWLERNWTFSINWTLWKITKISELKHTFFKLTPPFNSSMCPKIQNVLLTNVIEILKELEKFISFMYMHIVKPVLERSL